MVSKSEFDNIVTAVTYSMKELIAAETAKTVKEMMGHILDGTIRDQVRDALRSGVVITLR
jgi:hypothetical protein